MTGRKAIRFIVPAVLAALIAVVLLKPWDRTGHALRQIRLRDISATDRIECAGWYDTTVLVRQDAEWMIEGEPANQIPVQNLLFAAANLEITSVYKHRPAPESTDAVWVSFYRDRKRILSYGISGGKGRFLLTREGDDDLYRVELPGFEDTDLMEVFSAQPNHYREHLLIDLLPSEIRTVEVERKGEIPYRITMDDAGNFTYSLPGSGSHAAGHALDELSLRLLFSYFTNIRYEDKLDGSPYSEAVEPDTSRFMASLTVESRTGEKHTLDIYSMPADQGPGNNMYKAMVFHNDTSGPLVVNFIYLDVLMRPLSAYYVDKP